MINYDMAKSIEGKQSEVGKLVLKRGTGGAPPQLC